MNGRVFVYMDHSVDTDEVTAHPSAAGRIRINIGADAYVTLSPSDARKLASRIDAAADAAEAGV